MSDTETEENLPLYKIVLVGELGVGKSSIYKRFKDDSFTLYGTISDVVDRWTKVVQLKNERLKICLWDTAGMERTGSLTSHYYRGSHAILFVCSIEDTNSLNILRNWDDEVSRYEPKVKKYLVVNKYDLDKDEHHISLTGAQSFADGKNFLGVYQISAKTGHGVDEMFKSVLRSLRETSLPSIPVENPFKLTQTPKLPPSKSPCSGC